MSRKTTGDSIREVAKIVDSLQKKCELQADMIARQHEMIVAQGVLIAALKQTKGVAT